MLYTVGNDDNTVNKGKRFAPLCICDTLYLLDLLLFYYQTKKYFDGLYVKLQEYISAQPDIFILIIVL